MSAAYDISLSPSSSVYLSDISEAEICAPLTQKKKARALFGYDRLGDNDKWKLECGRYIIKRQLVVKLNHER